MRTRGMDLNESEMDLNECEMDLNECEMDLNESEMDLNECEMDLNECEHFLKVNLDQSKMWMVFHFVGGVVVVVRIAAVQYLMYNFELVVYKP